MRYSKSTLGAICALILGTMTISLGAAPAAAHTMYERSYDSYDDSYVRTVVPHRHRSDGSIVVTRRVATTYDPYSRPYSTYRPYNTYQPYNTYDPYYNDRNGYAPYYRDNNLGRQLLGTALGYGISRM